MFAQRLTGASTFGAAGVGGGMGGGAAAAASKDIAVANPPSDSVSHLEFSPLTDSTTSTYLIGSSWDSQVRCWEVQQTGETIMRASQSHAAPVLDCCWHPSGTKVFSASCDKLAKAWDLQSNQSMVVAQHDAPIRTVHWIKAPTYECLMTGSWDKTLKFWDLRSSQPILTLPQRDRVFCADVMYPLAVVCTGNNGIALFNLENQPSHVKNVDSPLKFQHRSVCIFPDKKNMHQPAGFAVGSIEGRCAIQYLNPQGKNDSFAFKCHRQTEASTQTQDVFAVNDIKVHPQHCTLATVGSDGQYNFWDKDNRVRIKVSERMQQPISACAISARGDVFAYSVCYDWSKGHEFNSPQAGCNIYLRAVQEEMKRKKR